MKLPFIIRIVAYFILPLFLITYLAVFFTSPKDFGDHYNEISFWNKRGQHLNAANAALELISADSKNLEAHYLFLNQYAKLSDRDKKKLRLKIEDVFGNAEHYYYRLINYKDSVQQQIGYYGYYKLRSLRTFTPDSKQLLADSVTNIDLQFPYFNELKGDMVVDFSLRSALRYYESELRINPDNVNAKEKLFIIGFATNNHEMIREMLEDDDVANNFRLYYEIRVYNFNNSPMDWVSSILDQYLVFNDPVVILNAFLIFWVWLGFLLYIDVFKDINVSVLWTSLILSVLSTPFVITLYDLYYFNLPDNFDENIVFKYLVVGLFEESSKMIIPLILSLFLISRLKSPFSVLILFSVSALGFATLENMVYFGNYYDLSIVSVRAVYSVTLHLTATTLVGYGLIQFLYRDRSFVFPIINFMLAVTLHALYDLLIELQVGYLNIPIIIMCIYILVSIYNNTLNNSKNFNPEKETSLNKSGAFLVIGLSLVMLVEFISNSFQYGFALGQATLADSSLGYGWLVLLFASPISNFKLVKEKWSFINLGGMKLYDNIAFDIKKIKVKPFPTNKIKFQKEEMVLEIFGQVRSASEKKWFKCKDSDSGELFLVSFKEDGDHFIDSGIVLHLVKADENVKNSFDSRSLPYIGLFHSSPVFDE